MATKSGHFRTGWASGCPLSAAAIVVGLAIGAGPAKAALFEAGGNAADTRWIASDRDGHMVSNTVISRDSGAIIASIQAAITGILPSDPKSLAVLGVGLIALAVIRRQS